MEITCDEHVVPLEGWYREKPTIRRVQHSHLRMKRNYDQHREKQRTIKRYSVVFEQFLSYTGSSALDSAKVDLDENTLEDQFKEQAEKWQRETEHLSSPTQRVMHPSYQAILGMGNKVVPILLRDLQQNRRPWFWALSYLTQENPINPKDSGRIDQMIEAWVRWGKEKDML